MPNPTHMVTMPYFTLWRFMACTKVVVSLAPVAHLRAVARGHGSVSRKCRTQLTERLERRIRSRSFIRIDNPFYLSDFSGLDIRHRLDDFEGTNLILELAIFYGIESVLMASQGKLILILAADIKSRSRP